MLEKIKLNLNVIKQYKPKHIHIDSKTEKFLHDCLVNELNDVLNKTKLIDKQGKLTTISMKHILSLKGYNLCI